MFPKVKHPFVPNRNQSYRTLRPFILLATLTVLALFAFINPPTTHAQLPCTFYNLTLPAANGGYVVGTYLPDLAADLQRAVECANVNGTNDLIDLDGQTVTLTSAPAAYDSTGFNGLQPIANSGTLMIQNGTIERDSSLDCVGDTGDRTEFRLLRIRNPAQVLLRNLTLKNGCAQDIDAGQTFDYYGGAIMNLGILRLNTVHFTDNIGGWGGALYNEETVIGANVSFVDNSLYVNGTAGAALYHNANGTSTTLVNTTFSNNDGGNVNKSIIYVEDNGEFTLINSTLTGNASRVIDFHSIARDDGTHLLHNIVLADNQGANNCDSDVLNAVNLSATGSYSDDATCGLAANGGTDNASVTLASTGTAATNGTVYHLLRGGDAVDGGSNALLPSESDLGIDVDQDGTIEGTTISVDQRGDGYGRKIGGIVDAGAVEFNCANEYNTPLSTGGYTVGTVLSDLASDLRQAIACANSNATADTIILSADITLQDVDNNFLSDGNNGLPVIDSTITLNGAGFTLERDSSFTSCNGTFTDFRLFYVTEDGNLTLNNIILNNGCARGSNDAGRGGAIFNGRKVQLTEATLSNNTAQGQGGAIYNRNSNIGAGYSHSELTIQRSLFQDNSAANGGGIYNIGIMTLVNNTLSGNTAVTNGGGLYSQTVEQTALSFNTFADNTAPTGSGIFVDSGGTLNLNSTLIASNSGSDCAGSGSVTGSYNVIEDSGSAACNLGGTNQTGVNPNLGALADNGGSTWTHMPQAFSPAIDQIPNGVNGCGSTYTNDQRGYSRPFDGLCDSGAVEVSVNYAPLAAADTYTTTEDTTLNTPAPGVLGNDGDGDWDTLTAVPSTSTSNGDLTFNDDGSFIYTPTLNYNGSDWFSYYATDGESNTAVVIVTLTILPVNDAPVAVADTYATAQNVTLTVPAPGVLDNDSDADGDTLTATLQSGAGNGSLVLNGDGSFIYTPTLNFIGTDNFSYLADDGSGPLAYWQFDEGSGTTALDSGGRYTGTINGALYTTTVPVTPTFANPYALSFDGVDDYMTAPMPSSLTGDTSFSVSFWMNYTATPSRMWIMDMGVPPGATAAHWLVNSDGSTQFGFWSGVQNKFDISSHQGQWVFVTTVYDADSNTLTTYLNGAVVDTDAGATPNLQPSGGLRIARPVGAESYYKGLLDDVRLYGRALAATEIPNIMTSQQLGFDDTAVVTITVGNCSARVQSSGTVYSSVDSSAVQTAVDNANSGDLVKVAGTCAGVQSQGGLTQTVYISQNLTLQGGYTYTNWAMTPDPTTYPTILDAEGNGRVVYIPDNGNEITLDSLIITNGYAGGTALAGYGGGIFSRDNVTVTHSFIQNNIAEHFGGGMFVVFSHLNMQNSVVQDNVSAIASNDAAGGLYISNASAQIMNSSILSNTSYSAGGLFVGANTDIYIEGSTIAYNTAARQGGGINNQEGTITVVNSSISENRTTDLDGLAGGILSFSVTDGITATVTLSHTTVANNFASDIGGIFTADASTRMLRDMELTILEDIFSPDKDRLQNGDVALAQTFLYGSIVANNSNGDCAASGASAVVDATAGYDLDSDGTCVSGGGTGNITSATPGIDALADNGGDTWTHALVVGSPAIDAIPAGSCSQGTDQRGVTRPQNSSCDIGAYELWRVNAAIGMPSLLTLTWAEAAASCTYDVYRATVPYAPPATATYSGQSTGGQYVGWGDVIPNYFYVVKAICGGRETAVSNEVGEFDFAIVPGS